MTRKTRPARPRTTPRADAREPLPSLVPTEADVVARTARIAAQAAAKVRRGTLRPEDVERFVIDTYVKRHAAAAATCRKCESPLRGRYCSDETCPYSDWPQAVELRDMHEMSTAEIERKHNVRKRRHIP